MVEIIQVIGTHIVVPICVAGAVIMFLWMTLK